MSPRQALIEAAEAYGVAVAHGPTVPVLRAEERLQEAIDALLVADRELQAQRARRDLDALRRQVA